MSEDKSNYGAPTKEIDFEQLDKLLKIGATGEEVAHYFDVNYDTLNARIIEKFKLTFSEYHKKHAAEFKTSLRRLQIRSAMGETEKDANGNSTGRYTVPPSVTMQIWLGKQYLGQKDKKDITTDDKPFAIILSSNDDN